MSNSELVMIIVHCYFSFHETDFLVAKDWFELSQSPPFVQYFRYSKFDLNFVLYACNADVNYVTQTDA